jgi:hypothetical protein
VQPTSEKRALSSAPLATPAQKHQARAFVPCHVPPIGPLRTVFGGLGQRFKGDAMRSTCLGAGCSASSNGRRFPFSANFSRPREYGSCVCGSRAHMRTYRKHTVLSMMSSLSRVSLPIPCQGARQGKDFPCHGPENHGQVIDFVGLSAGNRKNFPDIPCRQGKLDATLSPRLSGLPPFAPGNKLSADTGRRCEASRGESGWICGARSRW